MFDFIKLSRDSFVWLGVVRGVVLRENINVNLDKILLLFYFKKKSVETQFTFIFLIL